MENKILKILYNSYESHADIKSGQRKSKVMANQIAGIPSSLIISRMTILIIYYPYCKNLHFYIVVIVTLDEGIE